VKRGHIKNPSTTKASKQAKESQQLARNPRKGSPHTHPIILAHQTLGFYTSAYGNNTAATKSIGKACGKIESHNSSFLGSLLSLESFFFHNCTVNSEKVQGDVYM